MPRTNINYQRTIIYKIVCNDLNIKDIYVGHTTDFVKRKYSHKERCNNPNSKKYNLKIYKIIRENDGWDNWSMIEIEKYPCNDKNEACSRERYWYEQLNSNLNTIRPMITKEEIKKEKNIYNKEYAEKNKIKISERMKKNYEKNKLNQDENIIKNKKEYLKNYYENNKEKLLINQKEYYEENKEKIKQIQKRYCEENDEKLKETQKKYREVNKEKLNKISRIYRESHLNEIKEKSKKEVICSCGYCYTIQHKARHEKTKRHIDNMAKLE